MSPIEHVESATEKLLQSHSVKSYDRKGEMMVRFHLWNLSKVIP